MKTAQFLILISLVLIYWGCQKELAPVLFNDFEINDLTETTCNINISLKEINDTYYNEGVVYGKNILPTISDSSEFDFFSDPLNYTIGISGLQPGTKYYLRAFVETLSGIVYSDTFSIYTSPPNWFVDPRDGSRYLTKNYGGKTWIVQNLDYKTKNSKYFMNDSVGYSKDFGRLYNYHEALEACPPGWKLPSQQDWIELFKFVGATEEMAFNSVIEPGKRLWQKNYEANITNSSGFTIRPSGSLSIANGNEEFSDKGRSAVFWTNAGSSENANFYSFASHFTKAFNSYTDIKNETSFFAVRCVKE